MHYKYGHFASCLVCNSAGKQKKQLLFLPSSFTVILLPPSKLLQLHGHISLKNCLKCNILNRLIVTLCVCVCVKQRTPIILVCVIPAFVRSLYLVIKKGLCAHTEGGWPNEGRERVSTHVILVNEFRQSFFYNEYFSSYCSELLM